MLTLLKKNLARGYSSGPLLFAGIAFIISLLDWHYSFPDRTWYSIAMGFWILSFAVGGACFETDLAKDNIRFLEYLPVRRSHIWLANYVDGLYSIILAVIAAGWHRTLWFVPAGAGSMEEFPSLFATRWSFLLGVGASAFWFFSVAVFFRTFFQRISVALLPAGAVVIALVLLKAYTIEILQLTPSWLEAAPVLFLSGLLFSAGGFLLFVLVPAYKPQWMRCLVFGTPTMLVIMLIGTGHLRYEWLRWKEISPHATLEIDSAVVPLNQKNTLVAEVIDKRSGSHMINLDLQTGDFCDLGRGLDWSISYQSRDKVSVGITDRLCFRSSRELNGLFADRRYLVTMGAHGEDTRRVLPTESPRRNYSSEEPSWQYSGFQWPTNGETTVFLGDDYDPTSERSKKSVVVADRQGTIRHRLATADFLLSESGLIVRTEPAEGKTTSERPRVWPTYILLDTTSGKETRFQLHGRNLGFSIDLAYAVIARGRVQEGRGYQSVILVNLTTQEEKLLIAENELPPVIFGDESSATNWLAAEYYPRMETFSLNYERLDFGYWREPTVVFDGRFAQAVWLKQERNGEFLEYSLISIDVKTGARHVLLRTDELPKHRIGAERFYQTDLMVYGFSADGKTLLYKLNGAITSMDIATAARQTLAQVADEQDQNRMWDQNSMGELRLSPGVRRIYRQTITNKKMTPVAARLVRDKDRYDGTIEIFENGKAKAIYSRPYRFESFWLDDEQIVVNEGDKVTLVRADGSGERQIVLHKRAR